MQPLRQRKDEQRTERGRRRVRQGNARDLQRPLRVGASVALEHDVFLGVRERAVQTTADAVLDTRKAKSTCASA